MLSADLRIVKNNPFKRLIVLPFPKVLDGLPEKPVSLITKRDLLYNLIYVISTKLRVNSVFRRDDSLGVFTVLTNDSDFNFITTEKQMKILIRRSTPNMTAYGFARLLHYFLFVLSISTPADGL